MKKIIKLFVFIFLIVIFCSYIFIKENLKDSVKGELHKSIKNDQIISEDIGEKDLKITMDFNSYKYEEINKLESKDSNYYSEFGNFSGVDTIFNIKCECNTFLEYDYQLELKEGEFKVVLVTEDKKIVELIKDSGKADAKLELDKGNYRIRFVGEDADCNIKIKLTKNDCLKVENKIEKRIEKEL